MTCENLAQAYDSHCNLVLGEVEETVYLVEDDDDDEDETVKVRCTLLVASGKADIY